MFPFPLTLVANNEEFKDNGIGCLSNDKKDDSKEIRRPSLSDANGSFYLNISQTFDSSFGTQINFNVGGKEVSITTANINTIVKKFAEFVFISFGLALDEQ